MEVVLVDFDETLCLNTKSGLETNDILHNSVPNIRLIETMQKLKDKFTFHIFTSRGQLSCQGNIDKIKEKYEKLLTDWLNDNNVPFDKLIFGKPHCKYIIDDCAIKPEMFVHLNEIGHFDE